MPFAASFTGGSKMTLTESCIAAAVVSTLMAIAVPALVRSKETYTLASAARDVAAKMHATRIAAIVRNQDCRMTVTSASAGALRTIIAAVRRRNARVEPCSTPAGSSGSTTPMTISPRSVWLNQPSVGR